MTAARRLRRHVARGQAGPAGRDDEVVAGGSPRRARPRSPRARRARGRRSTAKPRAGQALRQRGARRVLADAGRDPVADGQDEGPRHPPRGRRLGAFGLPACFGRPREPGRCGPPAVAGWRPVRGASGPAGRIQSPLLPPLLRDEADRADLDAALDALDHVVDGQGGDGRRGHRLHLDAGLAGRRGLGADAQHAGRAVRRDRHLEVGQRQRMAERDQLAGALAAHDAGELGDAQDVALGAAAVDDEAQRLRRDGDRRLGDRAAGGDGLAETSTIRGRPVRSTWVRRRRSAARSGPFRRSSDAVEDQPAAVRPGRATTARPRRRPAAGRRPRG